MSNKIIEIEMRTGLVIINNGNIGKNLKTVESIQKQFRKRKFYKMSLENGEVIEIDRNNVRCVRDRL